MPGHVDALDDQALLRYSRHLLLDEIGIEGQRRWMNAHVLIIGAGGLGSVVAMYLGAAGVGELTLADDDTVELTNLQRQIAHTQARLGQAKVESARTAVLALNPLVRVHALQQRADSSLLPRLVAQADLVIDCCDNFTTRQEVNLACVRQGKPLVSGSGVGFDGQLAVFDTARAPQHGCYACLYPPNAAVSERSCATLGVFSPLVGIIGSMQAAQALKLLLADLAPAGWRSLTGRLQMLDARQMSWVEIQLAKTPHCTVCAAA